MLLQVLLDAPHDDAHGYAKFHVQAGDGKGGSLVKKAKYS